jgi:hypothetical protein
MNKLLPALFLCCFYITNIYAETDISVGCSKNTPLHCMVGLILENTDIFSQNGVKGKVIYFDSGKEQNEICKNKDVTVTFSCSYQPFLHIRQLPRYKIINSLGSLGRVYLISTKKSINDIKTVYFRTGASTPMIIEKMAPVYNINFTPIELEKNLKGKTSFLDWSPWAETKILSKKYNILFSEQFYSFTIAKIKDRDTYNKINSIFKQVVLWAKNNKEKTIDMVSKKSNIDKKIIEMVLNDNLNLSGPDIDLTITNNSLADLHRSYAFIKNKLNGKTFEEFLYK